MIPADAPVWLRAVQFTVLPKRARRHGIRPVIRYVMRTVGYLARSRPRLGLRFAKSNLPAGLVVVRSDAPVAGPAPGTGGLTRRSVRATPPRSVDALPRTAPTLDRNAGNGPIRSHPGHRAMPSGPARPRIRPATVAQTHSTHIIAPLSGAYQGIEDLG